MHLFCNHTIELKNKEILLHILPKVSLSLFRRRMPSLTQIAIGLITLHKSTM